MAIDSAKDVGGRVSGIVPVCFVPFLEDADGAAGDLDVEFDVLGEAGVPYDE